MIWDDLLLSTYGHVHTDGSKHETSVGMIAENTWDKHKPNRLADG